ncbi:Bromodomain protein [Necator americanus]|uniref:Bromodomain protein n=1 Tax=Necator americanus TaxID=51031 RepID=W2TIG2_NECAM|nr:Bromodomain protein [Necator americanus]ETN81364.1 Bromodomain protein [Necator americanus]
MHFKTSEICVPTVDFKVVDSLIATTQTRSRPAEFVKFVEKTKSDYDEMVEYDCDEEDYLWIKSVNKARKKTKDKLITPELMEKVMDKLEKESCFEVVHFGNTVFLEPIEGVDASLERRCKLKCLVCRKKMGACLQCSTRSCLKAFHVTCAQQSGMAMQIQTNPDPGSSDLVDVQRFVYCHLHADDDDCDPATRKKRMDEAIRRARRSMAAKTCRTPTVNMPTLSLEAVEKIKKEIGFAVDDIVQYWYLKRKSRCGVPLIRRLQLNQKVSRTSNFVASELAQEDQTAYEQFALKRMSLETTRLLCEQVKKRELHKRSHRKASFMLMSALFKPPPQVLEDLIDRLFEKDREKVFASPVTLDGYKDFIKHPMDLSTMRKKVEKGKYDSIAALRTDVLLMTDNCEKFNVENSYFLQYGRKFRKIALQLLDKEEDRERTLEKMVSCGREAAILSEASRVGLYDVLEVEASKDESEQESDLEKNQSPLPADVASSESSAEEEDGSTNHRRIRHGEHAKMEIQDLSDFDGYHHNDLVVVDGIAGRVIDPVDARVDGGLPSELVSECRMSAHRRESQVCVYLFENENKWGWYPPRDVRYLNTNGDNMSSISSFKLAMKWQKKMLEMYSGKQAMSSR